MRLTAFFKLYKMCTLCTAAISKFETPRLLSQRKKHEQVQEAIAAAKAIDVAAQNPVRDTLECYEDNDRELEKR